MTSKQHWERVYGSKPIDRVSWYQQHAATSLRLIQGAGLPRSASIIDVGGGASVLADELLDAGYTSVTVLDLSAAALAAARNRLGERAQRVRWLEGNVLEAPLDAGAFDLWHDRAVFHFLVAESDRQAYVDAAHRALKSGGHLVIATFAEDGPTECSGLPVRRYDARGLQAQFGPRFTLLGHERELHRTPAGNTQSFTYCHFQVAA